MLILSRGLHFYMADAHVTNLCGSWILVVEVLANT